METKLCIQCNKEKSIENFYKRKSGKLHSYCKPCCIKNSKKSYSKVRKEKIKYLNEYYQSNHQILRRKALFRNAAKRAQKSGIEFNLHWTDLEIPKTCPILGIDLEFSKSGKPTDNSPSIDRKNPTKGYTKNNTWIISYMANAMKRNATPDILLKFAEWVYKMKI